ncbi:hypothetical protein [Paracoccus pacificus]|uniref:BrnA antitoxin of type II toxin-antitoxin system n=1 Tax=Paracoccus pacificus TaxID=1463598 RepID=A0ABW4R8Z5_9RHOB
MAKPGKLCFEIDLAARRAGKTRSGAISERFARAVGAKEDGWDAPRFKDLVERYVDVHLPNLAQTNASDQRFMLTKLVGPEWNDRLVTEITSYEVEKLLNRIAEGRARPHKAKPNNRARKPQGAKPTPVRARLVAPSIAAKKFVRP